MSATPIDDAAVPKRGPIQRVLDTIERVGDKVPHPAVIFLALIGLVIVLSAVFAAFDVKVTYETEVPVDPIPAEQYFPAGSSTPEYLTPPDAYQNEYEIVTETTAVESLLSVDGLRFMLTSPVQNFNSFGVVAVILVAMVGVGVAEQAGLVGALIRKLVKITPAQIITFVIVFIGVLSSVASDAGYLVLIPLGAAAFMSIGRHPLAGLAAAYAGVSAGFGVNLIITPFDGLLTEMTNEAARLVDPDATIDVTSNLYFSIASTFLVAIAATFVTQRIVERRLGTYDVSEADPSAAEPDEPIDAAAEAKGLRYALYAFLVSVVAIVALTAPSGAPLRNPETNAIIGNSPFMDSIIILISLMFLAAGMAYGRGAKTLQGSNEVIGAITKTFAGLAGLIFLLLIIAQFIAFFNYSNMATVLAAKVADWLESADVSALVLLLGFIVVIYMLNVIIPGIVPKWAIFAPVFVPLFLRLGVGPATVLAAYRIGDSPTNVITPLMVYLPFIVVLSQKYKKDAGVGTVVSLMLPYTVVLAVVWAAFFAVWYLLGIPLGPDAPVRL